MVEGEDLSPKLGGRVGRLAFAYLLLHRDRPVRRDALAAALWQERAPDDPDAALRVVLSRLRRALGGDVLVGRAEVRFQLPKPVHVDLERAVELVGEAERSATLAQATVVAEMVSRELLPGLEASWIDVERERLADLRFRALAAVGRAALRAGATELGCAETAARELIELAPFRETGYRLRIEALVARGDSAEALRVYDQVRVLLRDELGVAPSVELRGLHAGLLQRSDLSDDVEAKPPVLALPVEATPPSRPSLAGRVQELARLQELVERARDGAGGLAIVVGDPGIGKSRLAAELAVAAHAGDANVLWGRCHQEALVPYEPFVEVLRQYAAGCSAAELTALTLAAGGEFLTLAPDLARRLDAVPVTPAVWDPQARRHRLFESVCELLVIAGAARPLVVVFEDLHWADSSTTLLLTHLADHARAARLLVVGTLRGAEVDREHAMTQLLDRARCADDGAWIELAGLAASETGQIVRELAPLRDDGERLHSAAEGNPLFVIEALRARAEGGPEGRLPFLVTDLIDQRLQRLKRDAATVLGVGAVVGRTFELAIVAHASGMAEAQLTGAVNEALGARLVSEVPGTPVSVSFTHGLIRETRYRQHSAADRRTLHDAVAEAIAAVHADSLDDHLAELAGHREAAVRDRATARAAIDALLRAVEQARGRQAFEVAASLLLRADVLLDVADASREQRCDVSLSLADALRAADRIPDARARAAAAATVARDAGDGERLARAALSFVGSQLVFKAGRVDGADVKLLEEAVTMLPDRENALRARVLSRLCSALYYGDRFDRVPALSEEAVRRARASGEEEAIGWALFSSFWVSLRPEGVSETMAISDEIMRIAGRTKSIALGCEATITKGYALLRRGRPDELGALLARRRETLLGTGMPVYRWVVDAIDATLAVACGRGEAAEQQIHAAVASAVAVDGQDAARFGAIPLERLRHDQGRGGELVPSLRAVVANNPGLGCWQAILVHALVAAGENREAQQRLRQLAAGDFGGWKRDVNWLWGMTAATEACVVLGDIETAGTLHRLLAELPDQSVQAGPVLAYHGPLHRYIAPLAALLGREQEAEERFNAAIDQLDVTGARPLAAATRRDHARALLARGAHERAADRAAEALSTANSLGLAAIVSDAESLLDAATT